MAGIWWAIAAYFICEREDWFESLRNKIVKKNKVEKRKDSYGILEVILKFLNNISSIIYGKKLEKIVVNYQRYEILQDLPEISRATTKIVCRVISL